MNRNLTPRMNIIDPFDVKGYVHWELLDEDGKVVERGEGLGSQWYVKWLPPFIRKFIPWGKRNAVVNTARSQLAQFLLGTTITPPSYIGVGSGTNVVAASDTALQTAILYTGGSVTAKQVRLRSVMDSYTIRYIAEFAANEITTSSGNVSVREIGLFESASVTSNMWARININLTKQPTQSLKIYWYIVFERRTGLAIKSGESIATTGNVTAKVDSTLTFASTVTILFIHNDTGQKMHLKFNGAFTGEDSSNAPNNYDIVLEDGQSYYQSDEEIDISTVHVYVDAAITMPHKTFIVRGW